MPPHRPGASPRPPPITLTGMSDEPAGERGHAACLELIQAITAAETRYACQHCHNPEHIALHVGGDDHHDPRTRRGRLANTCSYRA